MGGKGCGCALVAVWVICIFLILASVRSYVNDTPEKASELAETVIVSDGTLDPANEGKLVMVTGTPVIANEGKLSDPETGLEVSGAYNYSRIPLQKIYEVKEKEVIINKHDINDPYDDEKTTERYVVTTWVTCYSDRKASFRVNGKNYTNPEKVDLAGYSAGNSLLIGEYKIKVSDVLDYITTSSHNFTLSDLENHCTPYIKKTELGLKVTTTSKEVPILSTGDEVGDIHIYLSYDTLDSAKEITRVGLQEDGALVEYKDGAIELSMVAEGKLTKEDYIKSLVGATKKNRKSLLIGIIVCSLILAATIVPFVVTALSDKKKKSALYLPK